MNGRRRLLTVRLRLTALYTALSLITGAVLLAVTYGLVEEHEGTLAGGPVSVPPSAFRNFPARREFLAFATNLAATARATAVRGLLRELLLDSGLALITLTAASACLGWLIAGRMLRPLRVMTARTRQISEENLHERLVLRGPRDELTELGDTVDALLDRLERSFAAQQQFMANASHELRTPLTFQRSMVEVALADPGASAAELRKTCERVIAVGEQQERLIEAMLMLARSQRGLDRQEPVGLDAIVRDAVALLRARAAGKALDLDIQPGGALVAGNSLLLERLVFNLVDNGLRYNVPGGWVAVTTAASPGTVTLRVTNSGPRVPREELARLMLPFQRRSRTRAGQPEGAGLGLAIATAIAAAHRARFTARARPEGGLDITVCFPVAGAGNRPGPACLASRHNADECIGGPLSPDHGERPQREAPA